MGTSAKTARGAARPQLRRMRQPSHSDHRLAAASSARRSGPIQLSTMPSPRSSVSVTADRPRNTPMPAIGINDCARWCSRCVRHGPARRTLSASSVSVTLPQTSAVAAT